ncbi:xanthine dehydrogenase family protein molybdopterin-binding subunit [Arthrobacter castelli]|uniref:xanthine dehydrogenase family protein molybdopterin-binding subunit n=1 Tax=Arthrobacter castelli TaxID=271431 RepID=UPI0003FDF646|nr:xanthine dehydrogenase family protein molybdopterin-binding subunit [Arthrobacter castelli]
MSEILESTEIGRPMVRQDGPAKVRGLAPYAYEQPVQDPLHLHPVQSTIALGCIVSIDTSAAEALPGVVAVLTHENAPRLANTDDAELAVLQGHEVGFRGQFIGAVLAESPEVARQAAAAVVVDYEAEEHDADFRADHPQLTEPNAATADTFDGDVDTALRAAAHTVEATYTTPAEHNNPMEPHTTIALWDERGLTLYDSTQGPHPVRQTIAPVFGLQPDQVHVIAPHIGGGFGSKGLPHANVVLTALAAQRSGGRPVKLALTRQQMFTVAGYRTPTIQQVRLGADDDGRLSAVAMDAVEQTSKIKEFTEESGQPARMMYATPNRQVTQRLARLDIPVPSWMRAPGKCPGMFGPEVAMDEIAEACALDPIELRVRNEPESDPETGKPYSSRRLLDCLAEGAKRFGWDRRNARPGQRVQGRWRVGLGVAASTYPFLRQFSEAKVSYSADGTYAVHIGAADLGTGAWTALTQIAADALGVSAHRIRLEIGDTALPVASVAGGSSGTASWGAAIIAAADEFLAKFGVEPDPGAEVQTAAPRDSAQKEYAMHSFGAQFAEVCVNVDTGEVRVPRMLGVFSAGRIINAGTARSQFIGGMSMGIGMALHEQSVMDARFGSFVNHDFAEYHVPANADIADVDAVWLDEVDPLAGPLGARGIGEIGIVGAAAAVANATYNATGIRVRDLPLTPDKFL